MTKYYRNEYLFSEIYLEEITQMPESQASVASLNTLADYHDYAERDSLVKWTTSYIHKVLYALGFNVTENQWLALLDNTIDRQFLIAKELLEICITSDRKLADSAYSGFLIMLVE